MAINRNVIILSANPNGKFVEGYIGAITPSTVGPTSFALVLTSLFTSSNPSVLRHLYPQSADPSQAMKLGVGRQQGGG